MPVEWSGLLRLDPPAYARRLVWFLLRFDPASEDGCGAAAEDRRATPGHLPTCGVANLLTCLRLQLHSREWPGLL